MSEEENLLTIFKGITEELKRTREIMEIMTEINYEATTQIPIMFTYILDEQNRQHNELFKLFKWYAEKRTGRTYK